MPPIPAKPPVYADPMERRVLAPLRLADYKASLKPRQRAVVAVGDPRMTVVRTDDRGPVAVPPPLDPKILGPAEQLVAKFHPGVPLVPNMSTGATDGVFLAAVGIPVYGPPGLWADPDGNGTHGLNERAAVDAVYSGRDFLTELVTIYANQE